MATLTIIGNPPGRAGGTLTDQLDADFADDYLIRTNDPLVAAELVQQTPGLPALFERYSNVPGTFGYYSWVKELEAKQSPDSPWLWTVTVKYSSRISEERRQRLNPLDRPPVIKKRSQRATRACEYDDDGLPMVNSAALPFDPAYEKEENNILLTIFRYEAGFDDERDEGYTDAVNAVEWRGGLPGTWKCIAIDADEDFQRGQFCVATTFQFLYKRSGWTGYHTDLGVEFPDKVRILDRGKAERVNGRVQIILDSQLHPIPDPVCLDGRGLRLDAGPDRGTTTAAALLAAGTQVTVKNVENMVQGQKAQILAIPLLTVETVIIDKVDVRTKTLTLVRNVDGTTAADRPAGSKIFQKSGTSTELIDSMDATQHFVRVADPLVFGFVQRAPGTGTVTLRPEIAGFIRIGTEEMRVLDVAVLGFGTFTLSGQIGVERAANGSTPAAHAVGDEVRQAPTFIHRNLLKQRAFGALGL